MSTSLQLSQGWFDVPHASQCIQKHPTKEVREQPPAHHSAMCETPTEIDGVTMSELQTAPTWVEELPALPHRKQHNLGCKTVYNPSSGKAAARGARWPIVGSNCQFSSTRIEAHLMCRGAKGRWGRVTRPAEASRIQRSKNYSRNFQ